MERRRRVVASAVEGRGIILSRTMGATDSTVPLPALLSPRNVAIRWRRWIFSYRTSALRRSARFGRLLHDIDEESTTLRVRRVRMGRKLWGALALLLVIAEVVGAQSTGGPRVAMLPFAGGGRFPRPLDVETQKVQGEYLLLGAAAELTLGERWVLGGTLAWGGLPGGCTGGCPPGGRLLNVAAQWRLTPVQAKWALLAGPSVEHATFDRERTGIGLLTSAGAASGIGPRLVVSYQRYSGERSPSSLAGWIALRLGR